jgi:hypothetical protein
MLHVVTDQYTYMYMKFVWVYDINEFAKVKISSTYLYLYVRFYTEYMFFNNCILGSVFFFFINELSKKLHWKQFESVYLLTKPYWVQ